MARRQLKRGGGTRAGRGAASRSRSSGGGSGPALAGIAVVLAVLAGGTYLYRHTSSAPAEPAAPAPAFHQTRPVLPDRAAASPETGTQPGSASSTEPGITQPTPSAASRPAPFGTSEEVFEAGARLYAANCAGCHGRPGKNGKGPAAAQFWDHADPAGAHAITQPVGTIYQATSKGNLVEGMPSYGQRLTDTQIWDLALLLKSAQDDLPEPVTRLLRGGQ